MPRLTIKDYKLRLILLNEWKRNSKIEKVVKIINKRLGKNSINSTIVQKLFKSFDEGNIFIFEDDSKLSVQKENKEDIASLLFLTDDKQFDIIMEIKDGRFMLSYYEDYLTKNRFIGIYDLFRNVKKINPIFYYVRNLKLIGEYLLAFDYRNYSLNLFKINYNDLTIHLLDLIQINDNVNLICPDQKNDYKFIISRPNQLAKGHIQEDTLVLCEFKDYPRFDYTRLLDNKLHGFNFDDYDQSLVKFCEIDLDTMKREEINASIVLNDETSSFLSLNESPYYWSENRFYGMFQVENGEYQCLMFDLETFKWSDVGISANSPRNLFIDSNEILTLRVGEPYKDYAFYRIPLKKPDTLFNLSLLTVLKQSNLYENHKYLKCAKRLPIQF